MRIGELARRSGASVRSLRYYESQNLLTSGRTSGGHREYAEDAVDRVALIRCLLEAGLGSRDVAVVIPCAYSGTTTPQMLERMVDERARMAERIASMRATARRLDDVIEQTRQRLAPEFTAVAS